MNKENKNIKKRGFKKALIALSLITTLSLTGCGSFNEKNKDNDTQKQEALLNDTIFDGAIIAQIQDEIKIDATRPTILTLESKNLMGNIYHDIINNEYITQSDRCYDNVRRVGKIIIIGSVFENLTEEDISKLRNKEFTKEDENRLICQIRDKMEEKIQEENTTAKTK